MLNLPELPPGANSDRSTRINKWTKNKTNRGSWWLHNEKAVVLRRCTKHEITRYRAKVMKNKFQITWKLSTSVFRKLLSLAFRLNLGRAEEKAVDCKQCSSINQDTFSSEQSSYFTLSRQKKLCKEAKKKKRMMLLAGSWMSTQRKLQSSLWMIRKSGTLNVSML